MSITTAARRIARAHNASIGMGGKLVFGADGSGGAWYSDSSYGFGADKIVVPVGCARMSSAQAQQILDEVDEAQEEIMDR